jgi:hypothetical protein
VWHRAAAADGADEDVAAALEDAAERSRHRGGAIAALERAATLSATPARRADRLLRAAELAVDSGHRDAADSLVATARALPLTTAQEATANWLPVAPHGQHPPAPDLPEAGHQFARRPRCAAAHRGRAVDQRSGNRHGVRHPTLASTSVCSLAFSA